MAYSLNSITTVGDCDALLEQLSEDQLIFDNKRDNLVFKTTILAGNSDDFQALLESKKAAYAYEAPLYDSIPPGERKERARINLLDLESQISKMELNKERFGIIGKVLREHALSCATQQLDETTALIALVTAHKATLAA